MVPTSLAINKLEQGTENTFRGRDDNATVLQELSEKAMQERATGMFPEQPGCSRLLTVYLCRTSYVNTLRFYPVSHSL